MGFAARPAASARAIAGSDTSAAIANGALMLTCAKPIPATSGPATFRSQGKSKFVVRKLMVVGPYGLSVWPAVAEADNSFNYLRSLETDYDGMPIVRSLVRNMALQSIAD